MKVDMRKERKKERKEELQMNCCLSSCSSLCLFSLRPLSLSREIAVIVGRTMTLAGWLAGSMVGRLR